MCLHTYKDEDLSPQNYIYKTRFNLFFTKYAKEFKAIDDITNKLICLILFNNTM